MIYSGLILHIDLTLLASCFASQIAFTEAEYNLAFTPKGKFFLADKGIKSTNIFHLFLILAKTLSTSQHFHCEHLFCKLFKETTLLSYVF